MLPCSRPASCSAGARALRSVRGRARPPRGRGARRSAAAEPATPGPTRCPACTGGELEAFYEADGVPSHSCLLLPSREEARTFPRGTIRLAACRGCGFVANLAHDPSLRAYAGHYEETQGFSAVFRAFADDLARRLVERHALRGRRVLEIGCGKGEFLALLCHLGGNDGIGIDPSASEERLPAEGGDRVTLVKGYFPEAGGDLRADAVVCRHTLEHVPDVAELVSLAVRTLGGQADGIVFVEVPDTLRILRETAFWDIYYEHCSYFTAGSLARLLRRCGLAVDELALEFGGQYVVATARPSAPGAESPVHPAEEPVERLLAAVEEFRRTAAAQVAGWRAAVAGLAAERARIVLWGSGSKGVSFLTTLGIGSEIPYVVDINPYRQGKFMAGSGQAIVAPGFLADHRPDVVIAMNPVYRDEIRASLEELGAGDALLVAPEDGPAAVSRRSAARAPGR